LIHRQIAGSVAGNALLVTERLGHGLAQHDPCILGRMVEIDVQVALCLERDVDERMAGELLEHVIEKADTGRHIVGTPAVEVDAGPDFCLPGGAIDAGLPLHVRWPCLHGGNQAFISLAARFLQGETLAGPYWTPLIYRTFMPTSPRGHP